MCPLFRSDKYRITDIGNRTGDPHDQTPPGYRKSDIGHQSSVCPMSDICGLIFDVYCPMSDVFCLVSDVRDDVIFLSDFLYEFSSDFLPDLLSDFVSDLIGHDIGKKIGEETREGASFLM